MSNERFLSRLFYAPAESSPTHEHGTRRCLRYMRLERRMMLAGDLGEDFETEEDHASDEPLELASSQNSETDGVDEQRFDDAQDELVSFDLPDGSATEPLSNELERASDLRAADEGALDESGFLELGRDPFALGAIENSISDPIGGENLVSRSNLSLGFDEVFASLGQSQVSELGNLSAGDIRGDASEQTPKTNAVLPAVASLSLREMTIRSETDLPLDGNAALDVGSESVGGPSLVGRDTGVFPISPVPVPFSNEPSQSEPLNSDTIAWLGAFADDLSMFDEVLRDWLAESQSAAEASVGGFFHQGPWVTAGAVTTGVMAGAAYQRKRNQTSRLEDDHYAVGFDVRLYPES